MIDKETIHPLKHRSGGVRFACALVLLAAVVTLAQANWPNIFLFASEGDSTVQRLISAPVHLDDDVMISLRTGYIAQERGLPAFNRQDLAQPSTSYLAPYLYAGLSYLLPKNPAVWAYAALGALAAFATFWVIALYSRSKLNAALGVGCLLLTTTHMHFSLNGWDHLFQAFTLVLAAALALSIRRNSRAVHYIAIGILCALGTLFRPDGFLISCAVLVTCLLQSTRAQWAYVALAGTVFTVLFASVIGLNYLQFEHFTPTTARLKVGASPSLSYVLKYAIENGVLQFSAATMLLVGTVCYLVGWRRYASHAAMPIFVAVVLTGAINTYNSDVFPGMRMLWTPASVMTLLLCMRFELVSGVALDARSWSEFFPMVRERYFKPVVGGIAALLALGITLGGVSARLNDAVINEQEVASLPEAKQFYIAHWIAQHLDPGDGPVGFFYLGVSYHLPEYEIADFLGKADEMIATSAVKWGPPGHNKWNIDNTLEKWSPQAIVPVGQLQELNPEVIYRYREALDNRSNFAFGADLSLNAEVQRRFVRCEIPLEESGDVLPVLIRADLAEAKAGRSICRQRLAGR